MAGLGLKDPKFLAIKAVIESDAGWAAMKEAIQRGVPPVCGVDGLLRAVIVGYTDEDQSIKSAGSIVAEALRAAGYVKGPLRRCPDGCAAGSGSVWLAPGPTA